MGKTTTAVSLAGLAAANDEPTLLVDLDPGGSLTSDFGLDPDGIEDSVSRIPSHPDRRRPSALAGELPVRARPAALPLGV